MVCVNSLLAVDPEAEVGSGMELEACVEPVDKISTLVIRSIAKCSGMLLVVVVGRGRL